MKGGKQAGRYEGREAGPVIARGNWGIHGFEVREEMGSPASTGGLGAELGRG